MNRGGLVRALAAAATMAALFLAPSGAEAKGKPRIKKRFERDVLETSDG